MREYSLETDRQNGAYLVCVIRQWDRYGERRRQETTRIKVPDFDIAPLDIVRYLTPEAAQELRDNPITTRHKALFRLQELYNEFDPDSADGQFMRWKIRSLSARAQAEEGRSYPFADYTEETLALEKDSVVAPSYVPEKAIEAQKKRVEAYYAEVGHDFTRDGFVRFLKAYSLANLEEEEMKAEFRQWEEELVPVMQRALGIDWRPNYEMVFSNVDEYWVNWTSGNAAGYKYEVNTSERARTRIYRGAPARLITHELLTHLFQHEAWRRNIADELINFGYGVTNVPGPEQPANEALANTITRYIPALYEKLDSFGKLSVEQTLYEDLVLRNFHIMVNTEDVSRQRAHQYLYDLVPSIAAERFDEVIEERTEDPRDRSYLLCYGYSFEHSKYAKRLAAPVQSQAKLPFRRPPEPLDKRIDFIRFSFRQPATMLQVNNQVAFLERQKQEAERKTPNHWYDPMLEVAHDWIDNIRSGRVYSIHGTREPTKGTSQKTC